MTLRARRARGCTRWRPDGHGQLAAVWLDLRNQGTRLFGAFSQDEGATWSKNVLIFEAPGGTICQCCAPSLVATGPGDFTVMFRNVLGESRDLYTLRVKDGRVISKPAKVGSGTWTINACPMDGGGVLYSRGQLISAWRRGGDVFLFHPHCAGNQGRQRRGCCARGKRGPQLCGVAKGGQDPAVDFRED